MRPLALALLTATLFACSGATRSQNPRPPASPSVVSVAIPPAPVGLPKKLRIERAPKELVLDGTLTEWTKVTPSLSRDGLRLYIAAEESGLIFAGEVPSSQAEAPRALSLTVTTKASALPKLGYMRDWSLIELKDEKSCDSVQGFGDDSDEKAKVECRKWRIEQFERRAQIEQRFTKTLVIPLQAKGRVFEGRLPLTALPPLDRAKLERLRVSMTLPLSTPQVFEPELELDKALPVLSDESLTARLLTSDLKGEDVLAVYEAARPEQIHYFYNHHGGYLLRPESPSPEELVVDLSKREQVVAFGDVVVEKIEAALPPLMFRPTALMLSRKGDRIVEIQHLGTFDVKGVLRRRDDTADLLVMRVGFYNAFGGGTCGLCPVALLNVQTVNAEGHFEEPWWREELGGGPPMEFEAVEATASPDGRRMTVRGNVFEEREKPDGSVELLSRGGREVEFRWDVQKGDYVRKERKIPALKP